MSFKKGDFVYYYVNGDNIPCQVLQVGKRIKINDNGFGLSSWVSPLSLTLQSESNYGL